MCGLRLPNAQPRPVIGKPSEQPAHHHAACPEQFPLGSTWTMQMSWVFQHIKLVFGILSSCNLGEMPTNKIQDHESSYGKEVFLLKLLFPPPGTAEVERWTVSLKGQ